MSRRIGKEVEVKGFGSVETYCDRTVRDERARTPSPMAGQRDLERRKKQGVSESV